MTLSVCMIVKNEEPFLEECLKSVQPVADQIVVVDTGSTFSRYGQGVILFLIQIGGLGVMTLASLAMFLMRQRVSLTDRIAVGQNLLHNSGFRPYATSKQ